MSRTGAPVSNPASSTPTCRRHCAPHGLCFSPDPVSAHLATVAGNIIENAGGPHALKYGVTYNHILTVNVVLPDGSTSRFSADDEGPDLLGVLIGSEGTLGIVTEATVALRPIAEVTHSLMGAFATARAAADTIAAVIASGVVPAAVEWLDRAGIAGLQQFYDTGYPLDADSIVLIDVDGTAAEVAHDQPIVERVLRERATEVRVAEDEKDRAALWYGRLNAPNSVVQSGKGFFIGDVTVPRDRIPEMQEAIQAAAARHSDGLLFIAVCGHAGDGDLHPTTFYDKDNPLAASALEAANNEIIEAALDLGGTITGEHGVGTEKIQFMTKRFTPVEIAAQRVDQEGVRSRRTAQSRDHAARPISRGARHQRVRRRGSRRPHRCACTPIRPPRSPPAATPTSPSTSATSAWSSAPMPPSSQSTATSTSTASPAPRSPPRAANAPSESSWPPPPAPNGTTSGTPCSAPTSPSSTGRLPARFGAETMKDVAGYDTKRLYISAHGAFGALMTLIFKITVKA